MTWKKERGVSNCRFDIAFASLDISFCCLTVHHFFVLKEAQRILLISMIFRSRVESKDEEMVCTKCIYFAFDKERWKEWEGKVIFHHLLSLTVSWDLFSTCLFDMIWCLEEDRDSSSLVRQDQHQRDRNRDTSEQYWAMKWSLLFPLSSKETHRIWQQNQKPSSWMHTWSEEEKEGHIFFPVCLELSLHVSSWQVRSSLQKWSNCVEEERRHWMMISRNYYWSNFD